MSSSLAIVSPSSMATRIINPHTTTNISKPSNLGNLCSTTSGRRRRRQSVTCKALPPSSSSINEFDLYELLGIDSSSGHPEIKKAYRSMQKRCHPDIAGAVGHDMAIILNEAYALLSDPISRAVYDKEQAKMTEMRGYTGSPVYSAWFGSESEQRAIFVDEVKCVGCLKCALFASKTFAIESVYGRARVVAQWADPENLIQESIDACPVNCISTVDRSELPALEFLMSKQPRGSVRIGVGNTVGARVTDVFSEAEAFKRRLESKNKEASSAHSAVPDPQRDRRMSAVQTILSISRWLYQRPLDGSSPQKALTRIGLKSPTPPRVDKLKMAAAARKAGVASRTKPDHLYGGEYWVPSAPALPQGACDVTTSAIDPSLAASASARSKTGYKKRRRSVIDERRSERSWLVVWGIPAGAYAIGAIAVGLQRGGGVGGLTEHVAGPVALEIINSFLLQAALAGVPWYIAGLAVVSIIEAFGRRDETNQDE